MTNGNHKENDDDKPEKETKDMKTNLKRKR